MKMNVLLLIWVILLTIWGLHQHYSIKTCQYYPQQIELQLEEIKNNFIPEKDLLQKTKKYPKPGFGRI